MMGFTKCLDLCLYPCYHGIRYRDRHEDIYIV